MSSTGSSKQSASAQRVSRPQLRGVDHTARPTWKLRETVDFYSNILGLPLVHVVSARGWGPATHPDFLHFFFDSGEGSTIAFFYYLGEPCPDDMKDRGGKPAIPEDHIFDATHTAWIVESEEELQEWKTRLEELGIPVVVRTRHEVVESLYVRDPNGYFVEFALRLRPLNEVDVADAGLTMKIALEAEASAQDSQTTVADIDEIWFRKAAYLDELYARERTGAAVYVPRVEEFSSVVRFAEAHQEFKVYFFTNHVLIESAGPFELHRKVLNLKPAVWYALFTGGVRGKIDVFDRNVVTIKALGN